MWNPFIKASKTPKENIDFKFIDREDTDLTSVLILKGPYKGVSYVYGYVTTEVIEGTCNLRFSYEITGGKQVGYDYENDYTFTNTLGDILQAIVETCDSENQ